MPRIAPYLTYLKDKGINYWYDKAIPGGVEWATLIEQKISDCKFMLVFLSQGAIDSKWVRREVKYADAKNKQIISVTAGDVKLRHGLDLTLNQYQIISENRKDFLEELLRSIEHVTNHKK